MKKIGFLLFAILFGATISMAQPGGQRMSTEERAKATTAELKEKLGLNKEQEKKVYDLNIESGKKMTAMREDMQGGGDREAMREKMTKMRDEQNKAMKKILTEDQYKKYEKYLEERQSQRGQRGGGN